MEFSHVNVERDLAKSVSRGTSSNLMTRVDHGL